MNRIKIAIPENFKFQTTIAIRITDLNYGNHVGNNVFLELVHEARARFLHSLGYSELDLGGVSLIMADAAINFKFEIGYGDTVEIGVSATEFSRVGFDLVYQITAISGVNRRIAGEVKTGMLCFSYDSKKVVSLPAEVKSRLENA